MSRKLTALVVGISNYPNGETLKNPANDAEDMTNALQNLGFSVISKIDCTIEALDRAMESFKDNLNSNDVGLFYFAGHGMQIKGENYLNAIDTNFFDETSAKHSSFPLNQVIDVMDSCANRTNLIILDACRNNRFVRGWNRGAEQQGLASVYTPRGTLIAFATSPGEVASDGAERNGRYTEALLRHINTPDIPVEDLFKRVRNTLNTTTNGKQTSWEHTSLSGDFYFNISVGRSIVIYGSDAISDSQFILKPATPIKEAISGLKSNNWYTQNPALTKLKTEDLISADNDSLFVLGRNIYQAACGNANASIEFINNFRNNVAEIPKDKAKSILDGMLFEVFFNSKGELRKGFKISKFNNIFELKKLPELSSSFEFIAEALLTHQNRFYVIPGKSRSISIDISSVSNPSGEHLITGVYFEGINILRRTDSNISEEISAYPIRYEKLIQTISNEMVIPLSQLNVNTSFDTKTTKILFPYGSTLEK
ncbi:caspase family protein [Pseudomonas chlororaphis]|uniref:caspase family protein n=1 Tax=Pseudomonas chlororaphis TaxID=587753 RepID=UPI00209B9E47|nr:caspase family protein [Pseudomonas chlororaphis]MCO7572618.1 caspase family protein [Pseudomonas chlororaphis]MCO7590654.1 caspase family protein [Pseudomonas chlororaphis]